MQVIVLSLDGFLHEGYLNNTVLLFFFYRSPPGLLKSAQPCMTGTDFQLMVKLQAGLAQQRTIFGKYPFPEFIFNFKNCIALGGSFSLDYGLQQISSQRTL